MTDATGDQLALINTKLDLILSSLGLAAPIAPVVPSPDPAPTPTTPVPDPDPPSPAPAPTPPAAPPEVAPAGGRKPGAVFDLTHWYLTLPIADPSGRDGSGPWDVHPPALATFEHPRFFYVNPARELIMYAPVDGVTTSKASGATRSECREEDGRGNLASWGFADGKEHTLTVTMTADPTSIATGRREGIVGQIHDETGTPPIYLAVNHNPAAGGGTVGVLRLFVNGPGFADLLTGLKPSDIFTYRIRVKGGRCDVFAAKGGVDRLPVAPQTSIPAGKFSNATANCYFKWGAYNKEPLGSGKVGGFLVRVLRADLVQGTYISSGMTPRKLYTVVSGDTLSKIAMAQGAVVANLQAWNGLGSSTLITPGQPLYVSAP